MKILLLTDVPPCTEFSGSLLTRQLCQFLPSGSLVCYCPVNRCFSDVNPAPELDLEFLRDTKPREIVFGGKFKALTFLNELLSRLIHIPRLVSRIARFGREHEVDRVWCILQGQTMIRLATQVSERLGVPLYTQLWDHPLWWLKENKIDAVNRKQILREFENALRTSAGCGAASEVMAAEFQHDYGVRATPLLASLDASHLDLPAPPARGQTEPLVIGMAGQLYAWAEWSVLIEALSAADWRIGGRDVRIWYLGRDLRAAAEYPEFIEHLGYRDQAETITLLSKCDVLYCPYFFDPAYEIIARTSFPSKLTSYLAAGKPVLFHGPRDSSPAAFLTKYDAGCNCSSLDPSELMMSLEEILFDEARTAALTANGKRAFRENLSTEHLKKQFCEFLDLDLVEGAVKQ